MSKGDSNIDFYDTEAMTLGGLLKSERREKIVNAARGVFQTKEYEKQRVQRMKAFPALVEAMLHAPKGSFSFLAE
jgi:hypothetical protein